MSDLNFSGSDILKEINPGLNEARISFSTNSIREFMKFHGWSLKTHVTFIRQYYMPGRVLLKDVWQANRGDAISFLRIIAKWGKGYEPKEGESRMTQKDRKAACKKELERVRDRDKWLPL
jgi:hypothetical protein